MNWSPSLGGIWYLSIFFNPHILKYFLSVTPVWDFRGYLWFFYLWLPMKNLSGWSTQKWDCTMNFPVKSHMKSWFNLVQPPFFMAKPPFFTTGDVPARGVHRPVFSWSHDAWRRAETLRQAMRESWEDTRLPGGVEGLDTYHLVMTHIAMENGPFIVDFPIKNGDFP